MFKKIKFFYRSSFLPSSLYLFSNIFNGLLPLLLLPFFTAHLSPSEYGVVAIFQVVVAGLMSAVGVGYTTAAERKYFDGEERLSGYITGCIHLIVVCTLIVLLIAYFFVDYLTVALDLKSEMVFSAILVAFCSVIIQLRLGQWQVRQKSKFYALFQVAFALVANIAALILVMNLLMGAEGRIYALIFSYTFFAIVSFFSLYNSKLFRLSISNLCDYREMLKFCIPLTPHLIGVFLLTVFDRFIIKLNLGLSSVGIYMVGFQLMSCMGLFADAVNKVVSPLQMKILRKESPHEKIKIVKLIYVWFFALLTIAISSSLIFSITIGYVLPNKYHEVEDILVFLALGHAFNGVYLVLLNNIYYSRKTKYLSFSTLTVSGVHLIMFYYFTLNYGVVGASASFALSMLFRLIITFYFANRALPMPWLLNKKIIGG